MDGNVRFLRIYICNSYCKQNNSGYNGWMDIHMIHKIHNKAC